jgi:hypothetical protein
VNEKTGGVKGFDNQAFQAHSRQFSQATTASPPAKTSPSTSSEQSPAGVGETTYQEWLNKVTRLN